MWPVRGPMPEGRHFGGLCCVDGQSGRSKVLKVEGKDVSRAPEGFFISETRGGLPGSSPGRLQVCSSRRPRCQ